MRAIFRGIGQGPLKDRKGSFVSLAVTRQNVPLATRVRLRALAHRLGNFFRAMRKGAEPGVAADDAQPVIPHFGGA